MFKFVRKTLLWIILAPLAITWTGTFSNQAVFLANNDTFPVRINPVKLYDWSNGGKNIHIIPELPDFYPHGAVMQDQIHCVMTPYTHLNWLADNFDFHSSIQSIGDLLIDLGNGLGQFAPFVWLGAILSKLARHEEREY